MNILTLYLPQLWMATMFHAIRRQFFADHPDLKPGPDWRYDRVPCHSEPKAKNLSFIPYEMVTRSIRFNYDSDLLPFLRTVIDTVVLEGLIDDYCIGVTKSRATIFLPD